MVAGAALLAMQALFLVGMLMPYVGETCQLALRTPTALVCDVASMFMVAFGMFVVHKTRAMHDAVTKRARLYAFISAVTLFSQGVSVSLWHFTLSCVGLTAVPTIFSEACSSILCSILPYSFFGLVEERVRLTEVGFGTGLGSHHIRRCRCVFLVLDLSIHMPYFFQTIRFIARHGGLLQYRPRVWYGSSWFWWRIQTHNAVTTMVYLAIGITAFCCFTSVLKSMQAKRQALTSYAGREMNWAKRVFNLLRWVTLLQCLCSALLHLAMVTLYFWEGGFNSEGLVFGIVQPVLLFMEMGFLLAITGLLTPRNSLEPRKSTHGLSQAPAAARSRSWWLTVETLAGRGITLEALMDFYETLGESSGTMPHYKPEVSTTNDVVRQAIIPRSRTADGGGAAYADLLPSQSAGEPEVMVTHTWTGLFLDLVAAAVAEAHGLDEYDSIAAQLAGGGCARLRSSLEKRGMLGRTYWICAFSVNQHSCICDSLGDAPAQSSPRFIRWDENRRDSVTRSVFLACRCSQDKHGNKSTACEVNKFDDMLQLLAGRVEGFSQLVVVDRNYHVFERAWCVAELHRAHVMGMIQKVCLQVNRALDLESSDLAVYKKLATITVTACQASRPEDREEILSRIVDKQEFDEQLQHVIFGNRGLLARQLRGFGVLEAAARTAFRVVRCPTSSFNASD